jgi:MFS family permease
MKVISPDIGLAAETETTSARLEQPWPSARQAWYAVGIFATALMVNFLDRGILTLLVQPIKHDLGLTDTQMSLLMGFAFICFYVFLGLPIARLVDSRSRRLIIGIGIATWSAMTALCGFAQNFWQLFLFRVGVGVGEACNGPATYSMMADLFPREKLARAIAVLNFGFVGGTGTALIIGGTVIHLIANTPEVTLPLVGTMRSWQVTFFIVGLPGLLVAALMATVPEPARRGLIVRNADSTHSNALSVGGARSSDSTGADEHSLSVQHNLDTPLRNVASVGIARSLNGGQGEMLSRPIAQNASGLQPEALSVREVLRYLYAERRAYGPMFLGLALKSVLAFGSAMWVPTFFMRTYGWSATQIGLTQGTLMLVISPFGLVAGSMLSEWFARRGYDDAHLRVVLLSSAVLVPGSIIFPLMPTPYLALAVMALNNFVAMIVPAPQNAALQIITPNQMRGQVTALFLFIFNVVGFGLGPTLVAVFTDFVFGNESQLRYAMVAASAIIGPLAALVIWLGLKPYGASVARARAWS